MSNVIKLSPALCAKLHAEIAAMNSCEQSSFDIVMFAFTDEGRMSLMASIPPDLVEAFILSYAEHLISTNDSIEAIEVIVIDENASKGIH